MAIKKETLAKLLKLVKVPDDKIAEVTADGEFDLDIPTVHVYDDAGKAELTKNIKKGHEEAYPEIWGKEMNEKHKLGLPVTDAKDHEKVIKAMQDKAVKEAGIAPDAKVTELNEKVTNLQRTITEKENEVATFQTKLKEREVNDEYRTLLHPDRNPALDDTEWIERLKRNYEIVDKDGVKALKDKVTGKVIADNKENPIPASEAIKSVFTEKAEWLKVANPATEPAEPGKKPTHNPAKGQVAKKFKSHEDIMKEVDKKFPKDSKEQGINKKRKDYFTELSLQSA